MSLREFKIDGMEESIWADEVEFDSVIGGWNFARTVGGENNVFVFVGFCRGLVLI